MTFLEKINSLSLGGLALTDILAVVVLAVVCVIVRRVIMRIFKKTMEKSRLDASVKGFLKAALGVGLWVLIVMILADRLGVPMTSLVAVLSVAGLALSLSVQNILENLFSGITILSTSPFGAGDYVDVGGTLGNVKRVGLFYTTLRTPDGRDIHIPNSTVASSKIENYSNHPTRRIDLDISASYDDSTVAVKRAILNAIHMTEGIVTDPEPFVSVKEYGDSAIVYLLQAWAMTDGFFKIKCALLENIRMTFDEEGIRMTYNHMNIHIVER